MYIKELVLDGFKSFGRRTRIPLYEDFTVITGPNGSGKSNIIDGVLFALGLARTRGIRARKLTDLIYNPGGEDGDDDAGPDEASVTVVLDNADRTFERSQVVAAAGTEKVGDVDEIRVKRRVKRTEDNYYSYYYLNDRSVNLSDIQDLLAAAGVAPEGYNVVMQGDVTEIINMTPRQRRGIIDEIAGVAEFDAKKEDAFAELETVEERIDEADLRIDEKRDRLDQLSDERETALQYESYREEKAEYEGYLKAAELEEKRAARERTEARIEAARQDVVDLTEELDSRRGKVQRLEGELAELNREIERKGEDEQLTIKGEIEELKGEISRFEAKIEAAEERIEEAEADRREAFVEIDRKDERIEELDGRIRELKVETASVKSELADREDALADVEAEIEDVDTAYDELKAELAETKERLEAVEDERSEKQREKDRLLDEARRRSNAIEEATAKLSEARERLPDHERRISELESELDKAQKNRERIAETIAELHERKAELEAERESVDEDLRARQNEYAKLEAEADRNGDDSWPRPVTAALGSGIDGVHGAVGELASVPPEYATACETAAGGRLANVVVNDDGVGAACIDHLKDRNAGRATFLPLTELDDRGLPSAPNHPGVVDFARNLVEFDDRYAGVFSYVLGSTLVVETMDDARDLMGDFRLVTLDGDLVEQSGAMTGGSGGGSRYSFTKSGKGRLERVAERIEELEDRRRELTGEIRAVESDLEDARDRKADATERVRELEADVKAARDELASEQEQISDLEDRLDELEGERQSVDAEMGALDAEIDELDDEAAQLEAAIEDLEAELADSDIPELTDRAEEIRAEINDLEDRLDELDAERGELELEREYAEDALDELHDDVEAAQNRKAEAEERITELESAIEERREELADKREAVEELEAELAELKSEREELREQLRAAERERDEQAERVAEAESTLEELEETAERLDWEIDELEAEVGDYDPEEVPDHDELEARITELDAEMEALEPVNMLAIDEYDEVEAELAELEERRDTLVEERDGIRERIDRYEARKKETFMTAYESIDEQFREIFDRLSDGTGELALEDPEDPFEGGLTMRAEPGDKPVQRLDAMSGGEKSLTALAFIFAIQRHQPAPFYALDEIDAFLDAANAERVGEMIEDLAGDAQFVVVSHRSALLERSGRALGVTMQEENLSTVTGMRFDDSEEGTADAEGVADD